MKLASMMVGLMVALSLGTVQAAAADGPEGTWQGFLNPSPAAEIRLILRIEKGEGGALKAMAETPDLKSQPTAKFDEVSFKDGAVQLKKRDGGEFRGKLNPEGTEIVGEWTKGTVKTPLTFERVEGAVTPAEVWEGTLEIPGGLKLRIVFHAVTLKGANVRATMDSPDQGAFGLKVDTAEIDKESIKFGIKAIQGSYEGKLDATGSSATGRWKQGLASFPLDLKKVEKVSEVRRPQMPREPFPYDTEEVAYDSRAKGVRIAGTLTLPEGDGPFPAALLISGSGAQDRDETLLGHKPFLVLADDLTRRGIAVLRVDDRGVGSSTGDQATATTADFAEDVRGGVDFLKARPKIDPRRIGLIGHSEGGLIAPIVASQGDDIAFIVLMAGPGLPGDQILGAQQTLILKASGADPEKIRQSSEAQARLVAIAKESGDAKAIEEKLKAAMAEMAKSLPEEERKALAESDPNSSQVAQLATPWFRYFLSYDPRPTLARVHCPVLAVIGEKDLQVPSKENLRAVEEAVRSGGNDRITALELPGLNHLFQKAETGAPSEYATIEETINPAALKVIGEWVADRTRVR
ncbi:alpha/beta hydrolase family protein [Tundrisphaera lichenicola]|uniref:alpha/beta hydrolase family protein n=1 Tax=Tundrisphaera lichenicola TaxID=2029860 RepID=UPI003EBA1EAF